MMNTSESFLSGSLTVFPFTRSPSNSLSHCVCLGVMSVLWLIGWLFLVYESPRVHPRISKEELNYIDGSLAETGVTEREVWTLSEK